MGGESLKIDYAYTFGLPRSIVWKYLMMEEILRKSLPGCKIFIVRKEGVYEAEVEINAGPFHDVIKLEIIRKQEKPPAFFQLHLKGKGQAGKMNCHTDVFLKTMQNSTKIICKTDTEISGAIAMIGQRVLESTANKGLDSFFQTVEKEIRKSLYQLKRGGR